MKLKGIKKYEERNIKKAAKAAEVAGAEVAGAAVCGPGLCCSVGGDGLSITLCILLSFS